MKFTCDRDVLASAVNGVQRAVSQRGAALPDAPGGGLGGVSRPSVARGAIPVLEGILMKADGFALRLTCYNLELGITTSIEANVLVPGEAVLSAKLLGDILHGMQADEVEIEVDESNAAVIRGGITKFDIMGMNPGDFPDLPNPGADETLDIETSVLREIVETTLYAVAVDKKRPAHTGELFEITPEKLTVVALDGFRLARIEKNIPAKKEIRIIVPAKTVSEVTKLFTQDDEIVHVSANRRFVVFSTDRYTVVSRLIEGEFLDYERVIPEGCKTRVTVDVRDFIRAAERVSLIITERLKNPLRITFDKKVTVRCQTTLGKVVDEIDAVCEGAPVEIGVNNRYLLDALRNSHCDKLTFEINDPLAPVKVLPAGGGDFLYLLLPVRFKND